MQDNKNKVLVEYIKCHVMFASQYYEENDVNGTAGGSKSIKH
jgi:hypothetical protein